MMAVDKPIIYSCSGCSNIAQLANQVAVEFDREGVALMSCIAGVGGNVKSLVKQAKAARHIIALDGCALHCVKNCLAQHKVTAKHHYTLTDYGIKKRKHLDFEESDINTIKNIVLSDLNLSQLNTSQKNSE
ncbi:MAG: putative zinc-binding protein [Bermanella sp.]